MSVQMSLCFTAFSNGRMRGEYKVSLDEKSVSMIQVGGRRFSSNYEPGNRSFVRHTSVSQSSVPRAFDEYLAKLVLNKAKRSVTTNVTSGGNELLVFKKN